jgi:A/G-specific adenine glycosylase
MDLGTDLKKTVPNPNRRSRHYTKQAAFEGSDRKIRGTIIRVLLGRSELATANLIKQIDGDTERVLRILKDLEKEGFLLQDKDRIQLRER